MHEGYYYFLLVISCVSLQVLDVPLTVKMRTGVYDKNWTAHKLIPELREWGASLVTVRSLPVGWGGFDYRLLFVSTDSWSLERTALHKTSRLGIYRSVCCSCRSNTCVW